MKLPLSPFNQTTVQLGNIYILGLLAFKRKYHSPWIHIFRAFPAQTHGISGRFHQQCSCLDSQMIDQEPPAVKNQMQYYITSHSREIRTQVHTHTHVVIPLPHIWIVLWFRHRLSGSQRLLFLHLPLQRKWGEGMMWDMLKHCRRLRYKWSTTTHKSTV